MKTNTIISPEIIEIELSIKLLEYLKRENVIDNGMYTYVINKLIKKEEVKER